MLRCSPFNAWGISRAHLTKLFSAQWVWEPRRTAPVEEGDTVDFYSFGSSDVCCSMIELSMFMWAWLWLSCLSVWKLLSKIIIRMEQRGIRSPFKPTSSMSILLFPLQWSQTGLCLYLLLYTHSHFFNTTHTHKCTWRLFFSHIPIKLRA